MAGTRVLFKLLVLLVIVLLFALPLTLLKRSAAGTAGAVDSEGTAIPSALEDGRVLSGWEPTELEVYYPDEESSPARPPLSDKIDGGDVQFYEFGFRRLFARELSREGDRKLFLEEYVMADPVAAYGIFSANRGPTDQVFEAAVPAAGVEDRVVLQNGNRYCAVTAENFEETRELEEFVEILGAVLREFDPSAAPPRFPVEGLPYIPGSEKIVVGPVGGRSIPIPPEVLLLGRESPAWAFSVTCGDSFVPAVLLEETERRWNGLRSYFGQEGAAGDAFVAGGKDDRSFVSRAGGWIVVGSMIASDEELASFKEALSR